MATIGISREHSLNYDCIPGQTHRPTLVFLHEGLGCTAMWGDFPERLCTATGCPGLVYDRQGYGASSPFTTGFAPDYMHRAATEELPMLLERVIPGVPYLLIGHSDGGTISLIHAAGNDPLCRGIITEAAHVFVEEITLEGVRQAIASWQNGRLKSILTRYHGSNTASVFKNWSEIWLSPEFRNWNIEELLPRILIPALVIQGENDQYGSLQQVETIVSGMQGRPASAIIESCGHAPHREQPTTVISLTLDFIRNNSV